MLSLNCILVGIDLGSTACDNKGNVGNYLSLQGAEFHNGRTEAIQGPFQRIRG